MRLLSNASMSQHTAGISNAEGAWLHARPRPGPSDKSPHRLVGERVSSRLGTTETLDQFNDIFARYTLFRIDKPKSTFRIAPLAGAFIPTGNNAIRDEQGLLPQSLQTGSGTVDPYFGVTTGYNNSRWGMAADTTYRRNATTNQGISPGSELRSDAQFELRVIPMHLPEEGNPKVLWLSIEANYVQDPRSEVNGVPAASSGGKSLKQDVILEWTTLHWQLGVGGQVPVMQDLPGVGRIKEHSGAFVFFEYYLTAPQRRHGKGRL